MERKSTGNNNDAKSSIELTSVPSSVNKDRGGGGGMEDAEKSNGKLDYSNHRPSMSSSSQETSRRRNFRYRRNRNRNNGSNRRNNEETNNNHNDDAGAAGTAGAGAGVTPFQDDFDGTSITTIGTNTNASTATPYFWSPPSSSSSSFRSCLPKSILICLCLGLTAVLSLVAYQQGNNSSSSAATPSSSINNNSDVSALASSPYIQTKFKNYANQLQTVLRRNVHDLVHEYVQWADEVSWEVYYNSQQTPSSLLRTPIEGITNNDADAANGSNNNITASSSSWPFITIPHFEAKADAIQSMTGARRISFHPVVVPSLQTSWEGYATARAKGWMNESLTYYYDSNTNDGVSSNDMVTVDMAFEEMAPFINHGLVSQIRATQPVPLSGDGTGVYVPYGQAAPLVDSLSQINFDALQFDFARPAIQQVLNQYVLPLATDAAPTRTTSLTTAAVLSQGVNLRSSFSTQQPPESLWVIPVLRKQQGNSNNNGDDDSASDDTVLTHDLVALFTTMMPWERIFVGAVLPTTTASVDATTSSSLVVVVRHPSGSNGNDGNGDIFDNPDDTNENEPSSSICNIPDGDDIPDMTFEIFGPSLDEVQFLGLEDKHDRDLSHLGQEMVLEETEGSSSSNTNSRLFFSFVDACSPTITIYPSSTFVVDMAGNGETLNGNDTENDNGILMAILVVVAALGTAILCGIYVCWIDRRHREDQKEYMQQLRSNYIINRPNQNQNPRQVQSQPYQQQHQQQQPPLPPPSSVISAHQQEHYPQSYSHNSSNHLHHHPSSNNGPKFLANTNAHDDEEMGVIGHDLLTPSRPNDPHGSPNSSFSDMAQDGTLIILNDSNIDDDDDDDNNGVPNNSQYHDYNTNMIGDVGVVGGMTVPNDIQNSQVPGTRPNVNGHPLSHQQQQQLHQPQQHPTHQHYDPAPVSANQNVMRGDYDADISPTQPLPSNRRSVTFTPGIEQATPRPTAASGSGGTAVNHHRHHQNNHNNNNNTAVSNPFGHSSSYPFKPAPNSNTGTSDTNNNNSSSNIMVSPRRNGGARQMLPSLQRKVSPKPSSPIPPTSSLKPAPKPIPTPSTNTTPKSTTTPQHNDELYKQQLQQQNFIINSSLANNTKNNGGNSGGSAKPSANAARNKSAPDIRPLTTRTSSPSTAYSQRQIVKNNDGPGAAGGGHPVAVASAAPRMGHSVLKTPLTNVGTSRPGAYHVTNVDGDNNNNNRNGAGTGPNSPANGISKPSSYSKGQGSNMDNSNHIADLKPRKPLSLQDITGQNPQAIQDKDKDTGTTYNDDKPIADNFPNCTVMFADVAGFTKWSSIRDPTKVFTLLENLYLSFDKIAVRRGVFKVETIGDCYVAATGVPLARKDHATAMCRFARECMIASREIVAKLKYDLGDDTATLGMRFGMHSGSVTAGVLRGEKSRFQLFGDTINVANKIESLGAKHKIHLSEQTALHVIQAGKDYWIQARESPVHIDGKGPTQTYWMTLGMSPSNRVLRQRSHGSGVDEDDDDDLSDISVASKHDFESYDLDDSDLDNEIITQLKKEMGRPAMEKHKPLASLFKKCTIFFAEVDGFSAWSSKKEPHQVFTLLEGIYKSFDKIARRRKIFKVETIADCYVAAAGLPVVRDDHATAMAAFARECMGACKQVIKNLQPKLGTGSKDLGMRFGLHSGPVTAGILRGEKCRFQLFGDTVNTASRMETSGAKGRIQVSEQTARLIMKGGKEKWITEREERVLVKGKGEMQTYWLSPGTDGSDAIVTSHSTRSNFGYSRSSMSHGNTNAIDFENGSATSDEGVAQSEKDEKLYGQIDSCVEILERQLKKVVATRGTTNQRQKTTGTSPQYVRDGDIPLDAVRGVIPLSGSPAQFKINPSMVKMDDDVINQLRHYVSIVAYMYPDLPFNSFERTTSVVGWANRLLSRCVVPEKIEYVGMSEADQKAARSMEAYTNKIRSDPVVQFAILFAALIRDVEHGGVPNDEIAKQRSDLSLLYRNRCVNEQHALEVAWDLLMEPTYADLRACIYTTQEELDKFRRLVVNCVIHTDIFDNGLRSNRDQRWQRAFASDLDMSSTSFHFSVSSLDEEEDMDLKATVAIEHIIQGADWAHCMQQFDAFVTWNEKQFNEAYDSYKKGRVSDGTNPAENWYVTQLAFFETYIIPLSKRIRYCGLFGIAGEEYYRHAKRNRHEWDNKGQGLIETYMRNRQK